MNTGQVSSGTGRRDARRPANVLRFRSRPEIPTSGSFRPQGFSPSRRLALPSALRACFIPLAPLGFHRSIGEQTGFDTDPDLRPHGLPLQGSLSLRDGASFSEHRLQPAPGPSRLLPCASSEPGDCLQQPPHSYTRATESRSRKDRFLSASFEGRDTGLPEVLRSFGHSRIRNRASLRVTPKRSSDVSIGRSAPSRAARSFTGDEIVAGSTSARRFDGPDNQPRCRGDARALLVPSPRTPQAPFRIHTGKSPKHPPRWTLLARSIPSTNHPLPDPPVIHQAMHSRID